MGQICVPSEENEKKIVEYESLLKEQAIAKQDLQRKLKAEKEAYKQYKQKRRGNRPFAAQVEKLKKEKTQVFNNYMNEKKEVSLLEDTVSKYKSQISEMEETIENLKSKKDELKKKKSGQAAKINKLLGDTNKSSPGPKEQLKPMNSEPVRRKSNNNNNNNKQGFTGLGRVMDGIKVPNLSNLPGFGTTESQPPPFKVKESKLKPRYGVNKESVSVSEQITDEEYGTTDGGDSTSSDDGEAVLEMKDTILLDIGYDAVSEATHVYSWLHGQKIDSKNKSAVRQLKQRLASLLTSRSEGYRQTLIQAYRTQYSLDLEKDIKKIIVKGHTMQIIHGLLMTRAQYDAILIKEYVANWDIDPVADIICCRNMFQLQELHDAYKKKCKLNVKKQLQALAQKDKKKTLVKIIGSQLDLNRKEDVNVDMNQVNKDLNFVLTNKNFKGDTKERLVLIFTANSVQYIKVLNAQFKLKSKDPLTVFIDKKLGPKSTAGYYCKTRISYALDTADYYAHKIKVLGKQYKKNQKKIADIFIQRMEIDLDLIKRVWKMKKYGDGKDLKAWIKGKTAGNKSGYFLSKMLDNCSRYTAFRKKDVKSNPKSKIEAMMMGNSLYT